MLIHINNLLIKKAMALKLTGVFISCNSRTIKFNDNKKTFTINEGLMINEGRPEIVRFLEDESQKITLGQEISVNVYPKYDSYKKQIIFVEKN